MIKKLVIDKHWIERIKETIWNTIGIFKKRLRDTLRGAIKSLVQQDVQQNVSVATVSVVC